MSLVEIQNGKVLKSLLFAFFVKTQVMCPLVLFPDEENGTVEQGTGSYARLSSRPPQHGSKSEPWHCTLRSLQFLFTYTFI